MRLATFNIMSGRSLVDNKVDADRIRASVAALDADVLALQEIDHQQPRSHGLDLTALAAQATGAVASRFAPAMLGLPEHWTRAADDELSGPAYGIALVSRWPVREWYVRRWPALPVRVPLYVPAPKGHVKLLDDQPRLLLAAVIESPAGLITVACTHLSFVVGWNVVQFNRALRFVRGLPGPRYLLGDMNLPGFVVSPVAAAAGWRPLARRLTFPSTGPKLQLDHILVHPRRSARAVSGDTPAVSVSDHCPLVVDLP